MTNKALLSAMMAQTKKHNADWSQVCRNYVFITVEQGIISSKKILTLLFRRYTDHQSRPKKLRSIWLRAHSKTPGVECFWQMSDRTKSMFSKVHDKHIMP